MLKLFFYLLQTYSLLLLIESWNVQSPDFTSVCYNFVVHLNDHTATLVDLSRLSLINYHNVILTNLSWLSLTYYHTN
jgi:hypothetical protein